jgi:hypothetical protein
MTRTIALAALLFAITSVACATDVDCQFERIGTTTIENPLRYFRVDKGPNRETLFTCSLAIDGTLLPEREWHPYLDSECRRLIEDSMAWQRRCASTGYEEEPSALRFTETETNSINGKLLQLVTSVRGHAP